MFILCNRKRKIILSFTGLSALRPSLIPYLKVKHIYPEHRTIKNDKITLAKPCLIIVPNLVTNKNGMPLRDERGRAIRVTGNKANIPFPSFIPSNTIELLESFLNALPKVTLETPLTTCKNKRQVIHIIKSCYREIGYEGKPYDLRNFGSTIIDRLTLMFNFKDLKEYMLGHKPKIGNGLYTLKGLSNEKLADWTEKYRKACENWMNEAIFRVSQKNEFSRILVEISQDLGVMDRDLRDLERELEQGKIGREEFKARIGALIDRAQESRVRSLFERWLKERDERTERKK